MLASSRLLVPTRARLLPNRTSVAAAKWSREPNTREQPSSRSRPQSLYPLIGGACALINMHLSDKLPESSSRMTTNMPARRTGDRRDLQLTIAHRHARAPMSSNSSGTAIWHFSSISGCHVEHEPRMRARTRTPATDKNEPAKMSEQSSRRRTVSS